jgi:putative ABC transport system permease protein
MLRNYLKIAIKVLVRRKFFTAVSLFGITFTLTVLLVVAALADHAPETKLDRTLHIVRLAMHGKHGNDTWVMGSSPGYPLLDHYFRDLPGVEKMSIYSKPRTVTSFVEGEKIVSNIRYVDGAYWDILDFTFVEGGPFTQEDDDNAELVAVISEATRRRFFGDAPALDKSIEADGIRYRVVGVVENVAATRQSAAADIWAPHGAARSKAFRNPFISGFWSSRGYESLLLAYSRKDFPQIREEFMSRLQHVEYTPPWESASGTPMTRLEFYACTFDYETSDGKPHMRRIALIWLAAIAAFLLLPTVNLVNINLSRLMERSPEIGVRKAFGASNAQLVGQFILENVFLCVLGGLLALGGAAGVLRLIESSGWIPYAELSINYRVFLYAWVLAFFFGLLSGVYPAWRTSRLHPVEALRGGAR